MSSPHRKLYAVKNACNVNDDAFKAILLGETGRESAKGIGWPAANACVLVMEREYGGGEKGKPQADPNWREPAKSAQARKVYALWGILKRNAVVTARFPDGYVKRMTGKERAEWLTPVELNPVLEGLADWIKREGHGNELR